MVDCRRWRRSLIGFGGGGGGHRDSTVREAGSGFQLKHGWVACFNMVLYLYMVGRMSEQSAPCGWMEGWATNIAGWMQTTILPPTTARLPKPLMLFNQLWMLRHARGCRHAALGSHAATSFCQHSTTAVQGKPASGSNYAFRAYKQGSRKRQRAQSREVSPGKKRCTVAVGLILCVCCYSHLARFKCTWNMQSPWHCRWRNQLHTCNAGTAQDCGAATLGKACCLNHLLGLVIAGKHTHVEGHGTHHCGASTTEQASNTIVAHDTGLQSQRKQSHRWEQLLLQCPQTC